MGLGVVLLGPSDVRSEQSSLAPGHGCNNEAELHALCLALDLALAAGARQILLRGDSNVAVRHVTGAEHTSVLRLLPLIARAQEGMAKFDAASLLWVPRHRNADADRLSRLALGLEPGVTKRPVSRRRR
jgi:ribonuclease HI